mmetsp:Transcript_5486/g.7539  ORF Transcript_5486/g.7539 Transcript_5486/m.7539 type:complete len:235 (+) Transcript_5486:90-794(+)|eukprot:CAMPEP_0117754908 /NCGR_PEP_ID=MMETSP0947-20121206/13130_1 /TAXON_ID=44440 /ORGANISM="Chattonella subsalsa, Strain CCMP2191" /LENGTH=234 /DNA_ID=CAMNT_0005574129 /DNA_START=63 /DNA_END=767 /DNA_ORIENTATION=-
MKGLFITLIFMLEILHGLSFLFPTSSVQVLKTIKPHIQKKDFFKMAEKDGQPLQPPSMDDVPDFKTISGENEPQIPGESVEVYEGYPGAEDRTVREYTLNPNNAAGQAQIRCAVLGGAGNDDDVGELVSQIYASDMVCGCYSILKDEADNSDQLEEVSSAVLICEEHTVEEIVACSNWILTNLVIIGKGYDEDFIAQLSSALKEEDIECMSINDISDFEDVAQKISSTISGYSV